VPPHRYMGLFNNPVGRTTKAADKRCYKMQMPKLAMHCTVLESGNAVTFRREFLVHFLHCEYWMMG